MEAMHPAAPPPPPLPPPGFTKKRPLDFTLLQNQPYFKIRTLLKDARPHFLQLKVLSGLYKEMTEETIKGEKFKTITNLHKDHVSGEVSEKPQVVDVKVESTYIVGGSAFGWNFITFPEIKITYSGRTKESFRALNPKSQ